ncbi:MAG: type I-E CRISPR-associated protein Cse1/CasA, partial [Methanosarcinaceae archaeon]
MDKAYSFDLVYDPWIPCMDLQGQMQHLGLLSVLTKAHALQGVHADVPPTTAAILRLLLVILHRNFGPENMGVWFELWQNGQFDVGHLQAYLEKWRERFDLFHPQVPFYQSYSAEVKPKSINSLMMHIASGNAATLFNHETELGNTAFLPAEAAQALVTVQAFGLAGLCNPRLGLVYTDAPCARGMVLFLSGETLFETLMLNLVRYDRYRPFFQDSGDMPAWEKADPFIPLRTHPIGYLDFLTWQKRRIQLIPEKVDGRVV